MIDFDHKPWLSHYDKGIPNEIDIPKLTLVDLLDQAVEKFGHSPCIVEENRIWTYEQIGAYSNTIARFFIDRGIKKGDRVGILLPNTPEFVITYYGILKAGGVVMAMNPAHKPTEVKTQAMESGIGILFLPSEKLVEIYRIQNSTQIDTLVVINGTNKSIGAENIKWEELLNQFKTGSIDKRYISPEDPAVFQFSGGTTGVSKCAIGLHQNLVANVCQFQHRLVNTEVGKETVLVAIPMYHVYGMVLGMNLAVKMGARMVLIPDPRDLDRLLSSIQKFKVTVFPGVPNIYAAINRYPDVLAGRYDLSSIKACISGSATLSPHIKQAFESLTNGHLVEGYGLSEAPTATHCNPILGENRTGSIGLPLPNVDCRVVDIETGAKQLGIDDEGELILRGPQVMAGYHSRPDETKLALRNGWLFTGDVVRMDQDGYFYLVDRKKDVIKVGGFQVWPNEIEKVIEQHPKVKEAAVAGIQDQDGNEAAKAWVVLHEGETAEAEEIQKFCQIELTQYKIPRFIEFRESLPRTTVGKVLRRVLAEEG